MPRHRDLGNDSRILTDLTLSHAWNGIRDLEIQVFSIPLYPIPGSWSFS